MYVHTLCQSVQCILKVIFTRHLSKDMHQQSTHVLTIIMTITNDFHFLSMFLFLASEVCLPLWAPNKLYGETSWFNLWNVYVTYNELYHSKIVAIVYYFISSHNLSSLYLPQTREYFSHMLNFTFSNSISFLVLTSNFSSFLKFFWFLHQQNFSTLCHSTLR